MAASVAINGMCRIGRATFKIVLETPGLELVGINDLVSTDNLACFLKYDTVYGRYRKAVESTPDSLVVDGKKYRVFNKGVSEDEIVSSDIIMDPRASIVDLTMTQVVDGDLVKIMSWYDNEWGYSNQMVREGLAAVRRE